MGVVPSSSPVYTPIKRRKKVELSRIEPISLFNVQDSPPNTTQETQLAGASTSDTVTQAPAELPVAPSETPGASASTGPFSGSVHSEPFSETVETRRSSALRFLPGSEPHASMLGSMEASTQTQIPCSQPREGSSDVPEFPRPDVLPLDFRTSFSVADSTSDFASDSGDLDHDESVQSQVCQKLEEPAEPEGPEEADELRPEVEIPNSQWWDADETIDTDSDSNTQHYLKEILTESMVESLPLPSQQKRMAMNMSRGY